MVSSSGSPGSAGGSGVGTTEASSLARMTHDATVVSAVLARVTPTTVHAARLVMSASGSHASRTAASATRTSAVLVPSGAHAAGLPFLLMEYPQSADDEGAKRSSKGTASASAMRSASSGVQVVFLPEQRWEMKDLLQPE